MFSLRGLLPAANTSLIVSLYAVAVLKSARLLDIKAIWARIEIFDYAVGVFLRRKSARCNISSSFFFFFFSRNVHFGPFAPRNEIFWHECTIIYLYTQITIISGAGRLRARVSLAAINNRRTKAMSTRAARKKQLTLIFHQVSSAPS